MIDEALDSYRHSKLSLVRPEYETDDNSWHTLQLSLGGTEVWRRIIVPDNESLAAMHSIILSIFSWSGSSRHRWTTNVKTISSLLGKDKSFSSGLTIGKIIESGLSEILYEYGKLWSVKILFLSRHDASPKEKIKVIAGENAVPPEYIEGPLRYRRYVMALQGGPDAERKVAIENLSPDFDPAQFSLADCNRAIFSLTGGKKL
jgi:hypothetical protein